MKVAIIGAGACGLFLSSLLEKNNIDYTLFNKGKIGNKILASGNGRCNIGNYNLDDSHYHNNPLAMHVINNNKDDYFQLLKELKIYTKNDLEGRIYPISESSQSVLNAVLRNIKKAIVDCEIIKIENIDNKYYLNDTYGPFDKMVIATGSIAGYKPPYNPFEFLEGFDIRINQFRPSLVGFKTDLNIKSISGVRTKCNTFLYCGDRLIHAEPGEVIFKDNGISGICIMNQSSYYQKIKDKSNCYIKLDLLSGNEYDDYIAVFHPKLLSYIENNNIDINSFIIPILDTYSFDVAQVCSGGIDISEINNNLSLEKYPNVFVGGEVIDVDGVCGGYNLMFAITCGIHICKELLR